jgi:hypothetical protein
MPAEDLERQPRSDESLFVDELFELLYRNQVVLVLAQADSGLSTIKSTILRHAELQYGKDCVLHIVPPHGPHIEAEEYFSVLAKQAHFSETINNSATLVKAFEDTLADKSKRMFIMVSGFENSSETGQSELSGVLRNLNERFSSNLRILIFGGEKLADLYFTGTLSYLNHGEVYDLPELTVPDVRQMQEQLYPDQSISDQTAQEILQISGGHVRLLQKCLTLAQKDFGFNADTAHDTLTRSPFVWRLFTPFVHDSAGRERLCRLLEQDDVGPAQPYLFDPLLKRLYWKNIIKRSGRANRLVWRCEALRAAGKEILRCGG